MKKKLDAVFEGGGIKGITYVGAIKCLEEKGYEFNKVAGTSVGSLIGAMIVAGYTAREMKEILLENDFTNLNGGNVINRIPFIGKPLNLIVNKGIYGNKALESFVEDLLKAKGIRKFKDLKVVDDGKEYYRFKAIGANVSNHQMLILPDDLPKYGIVPDEFSVAKAVAMSCAIPFYFEPVKLNNDLIVDGGISSNFPIWIFDVKGKPRWPTLGFVIKELDAVRNNKKLINFVFNVIDTALNRELSIYDDPETKARTVLLPVKNVAGTDFGLTNEHKIKLYISGYDSTKEFLNNWSFKDYVIQHRL